MNTCLVYNTGQNIPALRIYLEKSIYSGLLVPLLCAWNCKLSNDGEMAFVLEDHPMVFIVVVVCLIDWLISRDHSNSWEH